MSLRSGLDTGFLVSLLIGLFGLVANIVVRSALRRRGVPIRFLMSGMPTYLLRCCRELPTSLENDRLIRLAKSSVIAFLIAMIGAGILGSMLVSLDQTCDAKASGHQDECPKAAARD
jgi:hypothetical protein